MRGVGLKRARELVSAAERSIGRTTSPETARMELENLLEDLEKYQEREKKIMEKIYAYPKDEWNAQLKETYLIGYYLQRKELYTKKEKHGENKEEG